VELIIHATVKKKIINFSLSTFLTSELNEHRRFVAMIKCRVRIIRLFKHEEGANVFPRTGSSCEKYNYRSMRKLKISNYDI
jgi:hypothetical protein